MKSLTVDCPELPPVQILSLDVQPLDPQPGRAVVVVRQEADEGWNRTDMTDTQLIVLIVVVILAFFALLAFCTWLSRRYEAEQMYSPATWDAPPPPPTQNPSENAAAKTRDLELAAETSPMRLQNIADLTYPSPAYTPHGLVHSIQPVEHLTYQPPPSFAASPFPPPPQETVLELPENPSLPLAAFTQPAPPSQVPAHLWAPVQTALPTPGRFEPPVDGLGSAPVGNAYAGQELQEPPVYYT